MSLMLRCFVAAMRNLVSHNKGAMFACVMDSYDYDHALNQLLPEVAGTVKASSAFRLLLLQLQ